MHISLELITMTLCTKSVNEFLSKFQRSLRAFKDFSSQISFELIATNVIASININKIFLLYRVIFTRRAVYKNS